MKSFEEIQKAHDLLHPLITGELDLNQANVVIEPETVLAIHSALDVLCWILDHEHNSTFAKNLTALEVELLEAGFQLKPFNSESSNE